ncbi:Werner Syndrome-like exonuclease [Triticum aestivum]|uniref:Werner Syndrome-like exonuclease n=1 Tax=Triticum aestivum TaxID=4565 RepID=UPI001D019B97|nr:Werner Syndrome-like exonuclease [Triticum aestivum]
MATSMVTDFGDGHCIVAFGQDHVHTTLTSSGGVVDEWLDLVYRIHRRRLDRLVVGLDVEWRPSFRGLPPGPVALLQLCVGRRCLVFQILRADYVPDSLFDFLADGRFTFVGVGVYGDAQKLSAHYGLQVTNAVDLRYLAANTLGKPALRHTGLQGLVWQVIGVWPEKPHHVRVSAWDAPRLTRDQLQYACADAFASFEVGRRLYDSEY